MKKSHILSLRAAGMFSNVNEVVQQLHLAKIHGRTFHIVWNRSLYRQDDREGDPWDYYFEQCFPAAGQNDGRQQWLRTGGVIACTRNNIITPRLRDGHRDPLLLPTDRHLPHDLIKKHIRLKPHVEEIVKQFKQKHFDDYVIGLHIRGLGRNHGGAKRLRAVGQKSGQIEIDYDRFFKYVNRRLVAHPEAKIFVCSDSQDVVDHVYSAYPGQVISYASSRSKFGEMHVRQTSKNTPSNFSPYKLGLDVIVEAYLLSATNYFVHGNSNLSNYVICLEPDLEAEYVYRNEVAKIFRPQRLSSRKSNSKGMLLVVSFGGVATTSLIRAMSKKIRCNAVNDQDGLKHLASPSMLAKSPKGKAVTRVLYVYNDPLLALRSLYRRNFGAGQHHKITGGKPYLRNELLRNFDKLQEATIQAGRDLFGLEKHFSNWHQDCRLPVMFVDMRDPQATSKISQFIGKEIALEVKDRHTTSEDCSLSMIDIYRRLDRNILSLIEASPEGIQRHRKTAAAVKMPCDPPKRS